MIKYSKIRKCDISNGPGVRVSIFTQGCTKCCKNCFNQSTWSFCCGKELTKEKKKEMFNALNQSYISGISFLGGDPIEQPLDEMKELLKEIKELYPNKTIWFWTGDTWGEIINDTNKKKILKYIDVIIDGRYVDELKDISLRFAGSSNQRVILVQESLKEKKIVLY